MVESESESDMDGTSSDSEGIRSEELSQDSLEVDHTQYVVVLLYFSLALNKTPWILLLQRSLKKLTCEKTLKCCLVWVNKNNVIYSI